MGIVLSRASRWLAVAGLVLAVSGCDALPTDVWEARRETLERNRERWERARVRAYRYNYFVACECLQPFRGPVEITVVDGRITSLTPVKSEEPVPGVSWSGYRTVEEMFAFIESALDRRAYRFEAAYHATLGYPTLFNVDFTEQYADDEEYVDISELTVIAREG